jgi:hypothetical protein
MTKPTMTKKQRETFNTIGGIFADFKEFFADVDVSLTQANTAHYQAKFDALMERAKQAMQPEKFNEFQESNTKRWERKKCAVNGQTSPIQGSIRPQTTVYMPTEKPAPNEPKITPTTEVQRLMQTIENLKLIIAEQRKIIDAERAINAALQAEVLKG